MTSEPLPLPNASLDDALLGIELLDGVDAGSLWHRFTSSRLQANLPTYPSRYMTHNAAREDKDPEAIEQWASWAHYAVTH